MSDSRNLGEGKMRWATIDRRQAALVLTVLAGLIAAVAIAMHSPGQGSMDTSMQLYEASTGKSISWNPPFMSALMRWLGGGELAMAGIVLLCSLMTYLGLAQVASSALRAGATTESPRIAGWRFGLCLLVILNPVPFIYVGIVWKDVLFSSVMIASVALSFAAAGNTSLRMAALQAGAAAVLLAIAMQVRQQGVFMAPVLMAMPVLAISSARGWTLRRRLAAGAALVLLFSVAFMAARTAAEHTIVGAGDRSSAVGFRSIMSFDIAGTISRSSTATDRLPISITEAQRQAVRSAYSSLRVDYLSASPEASSWLGSLTDEQRQAAWLALVRKEPRAFLSHKWTAFRSLLDLNGIQACLPIHIGVDGNSEYLKAVGVAEARDGRDAFLYTFASHFFNWPIYHHWCYALALLIGVAAVARARLPARFKALSLVLALASGLFYLSYLPTMISCDFRYLYGAIPLVTALWLVVLAGALKRQPKNA